MVDFVYSWFWCMWLHVCKRLKRLPLTLTSEARVLNPKACGVQGRSPGGGYFYSAKWKNLWTKLFQNFKSVHIYMKYTKCAETIFRFLVFEIWSFLCSKLVIFSMLAHVLVNDLQTPPPNPSKSAVFIFLSK